VKKSYNLIRRAMPEHLFRRRGPDLRLISTDNASEDHADELSKPSHYVEPSWVDITGRTRTWALKDPHGTQMAVITTKSAALKLAALLNRVLEVEPDF
jgi:hypothetical protein